MPQKKPSDSAKLPKASAPAERPVNLKILGEYLSLSPATISLVLNNAPGVKSIPQETRDRVVAAAKKFDYRPSFYARSLRGRRSFYVGVLVPELSDGYSAHVMDGIEELLIEEGYFYLTASHRRKADLIEEYPRMLQDRSVEGVIVIDTLLEKAPPMPTVAVAGHRKLPGVTNIMLDHRKAAELSLRHLYQLGHRQIAFMRGRAASSDSADRWKSLMAVAKEIGLDVPQELVMQVEGVASSPELGFPITHDLLRRSQDFTAIVAFNDLAAIGAIRALHEHGLSVPGDISVVGFDDFEYAAYNSPSLTTIRQPLRKMGNMAAHMLLERIRGGSESDKEVAIVPELVIRESTAPPPARRRKR